MAQRCWSVEAKVFEVLIKGGNTGVRIYESSKKKKSSIFIRREELGWLVGALEEVAEADKSEIFWDQSRAGCPRILTKKRENRHGRFLSIEEFNGRSRSGLILIPEGRFGQGWLVSWWNWMEQNRFSGRGEIPRNVRRELWGRRTIWSRFMHSEKRICRREIGKHEQRSCDEREWPLRVGAVEDPSSGGTSFGL
jgi:hypothetical protein